MKIPQLAQLATLSLLGNGEMERWAQLKMDSNATPTRPNFPKKLFLFNENSASLMASQSSSFLMSQGISLAHILARFQSPVWEFAESFRKQNALASTLLEKSPTKQRISEAS